MKIKSFLLAFTCAAALAQQSGFDKVSISIPGVAGSLEFDAGPTVWQARVRPDGKETQMQAMGRPDHLLVSAFLQRVSFAASPAKCRDEWWPGTQKGNKEHHLKMDRLQQFVQDGIARVEFIVPAFQGTPVRQKDVHAYLGARDLCAEIHLSKVFFAPEDQKLFDELLTSARVRADDSAASSPATTNQAIELLGQASQLYLQHKYAAAAERYQKALDLEKEKRTLSKTMFRVLIDNLGMSYGISGDLPKAKETFAYGITQDPEYPLFYYNMACTYGEMGKMDESLEQLRLAYKYKSNIIAGETFPDPMKDDSFRRFVKDTQFVRAVDEMRR